LFVSSLRLFCLESQQQPPATQPPTQQAAATLPQQTPSIKVDVQEVIVPVTVTDDKGKFRLRSGAETIFQIFDQGKLQNIQYFTVSAPSR